MEIQLDKFLGFVIENLYTLPSEMLAGNVFAIAAGLILTYIAVFIINKFTGLIIFLLKKIFLLIIVSLAFYQFILNLSSQVAAEGLTNDIIVLGIFGFLVGSAAFFIAVYAAFSSFKKASQEPAAQAVQKTAQQTKAGDEIKGAVSEKPQDTGIRDMLSIDTIKNDKSLGAVIAYIVIAQFGVFSSKTISAPDEMVGLIFLAVFLIAAVFFIRQSYADYNKGLFHFTVACAVGGVLSIVLGHFWGNYPLDVLLSLGYFTTDSLVALVTGLALSLFMGSR